jgi:hypothetical protein
MTLEDWEEGVGSAARAGSRRGRKRHCMRTKKKGRPMSASPTTLQTRPKPEKAVSGQRRPPPVDTRLRTA